MDLTPPTLTGRHIALQPLAERHAQDLFEAMQDEEVCRYLPWPPPGAIAETLAWIQDRLGLTARCQSIVLARVWNETGRAIGSTRLPDVRPSDRQVEIGATFLARPYWRTPANTESKCLLVRHCFERLGCVRVVLKTDGRTIRSQRAIKRRGAGRRAPKAHG